jgi:hypothetical protein
VGKWLKRVESLARRGRWREQAAQGPSSRPRLIAVIGHRRRQRVLERRAPDRGLCARRPRSRLVPCSPERRERGRHRDGCRRAASPGGGDATVARGRARYSLRARAVRIARDRFVRSGQCPRSHSARCAPRLEGAAPQSAPSSSSPLRRDGGAELGRSGLACATWPGIVSPSVIDVRGQRVAKCHLCP